jgi:phosphopantetheine adenylyltransferase/DNA-directed RNA polymerase subunit RPC12/RpoP
MKFCIDCNKKLYKTHNNRKRCKNCSQLVIKKPKHNLKDWQIEMLKPLIGHYKINEIAEILSCSRSSLTRYARDNNFNYKIYKYSNELRTQVINYYIKNGKNKTVKKFPNVVVDTILEHDPKIKGLRPRQKLWTEKQIIQLAKMAGLVSMEMQAKFFNRPRAFKGSIKSAWSKKFKLGAKHINGLFKNKADYITENCPCIETSHYFNGKLCLWVDIQKHLKKGLSKDIHLLIQTGVDFQKWLWGGGNIKNKIIKFMTEVENACNNKKS